MRLDQRSLQRHFGLVQNKVIMKLLNCFIKTEVISMRKIFMEILPCIWLRRIAIIRLLLRPDPKTTYTKSLGNELFGERWSGL